MMRSLLASPVVALLALAAPARAQMTATILAVGDRTAQTPPIPLSLSINLAECEANVEVVVRVANIPAGAGVSNLDFWSGVGCNDQMMRTDTTDVVCNCLGIDAAPVGATELDVSTTAQALLGVGRIFKGATAPRTCANIGLDGDAPWPVVVIGVTAPCSTEFAVAYATVSNGTATPFTVDTVPPSAPTNVVAGNGDTAVPVSWTASTDIGAGGRYSLFASPSSAADAGTCGSISFTAGGVAPTTPAVSSIVSLGATFDPTDSIACEAGGAIAVVAVDRALNESPLSNVACYTRTPCTPPHAASGGCCSVPGSASPTHGAAFAVLLLSGLVLRRRQSHR